MLKQKHYDYIVIGAGSAGCAVAHRLAGESEAQVLLLEVMKDMFYQCFVRRGKLTRAIKVRRFFVQDGNGGMQSSA